MESVQKVTYNINLGSPVTIFRLSEEGVPQDSGKRDEELSCESMGEELSNLTQAKEYISQMQSRLDAMKKELHDLRRKNSALQMQQFVSEEKNDLLDYLRSLTPEKVAELSESSCPGVQEEIHSVVHGLLATLSPKIHSKAPPPKENTAGGALNLGGEDDDCAEPVENASLPFQPLISVPRDYLARLLFWCMLFETAMFTDIPLRIEWKCLAEKWWRWRLHWIRCPKDALKLVLLSYCFYCSYCKVRKRPFGCKVSLTYGCTIFSFSFFILCCIRKENLVVPCC